MLLMMFLCSGLLTSLPVNITFPSKLYGEFCGVRKIGSGAYGSVYKVNITFVLVIFQQSIKVEHEEKI
jgi:hypothetical protein